MESGAHNLTISCLRNTIWHYLDQDVLDTAAFTAERLYALDTNNPESRHLIGLIYFRMGRYQTAMEYTHNVHQLGCLYVYAQSCYKLKEYTLGISAIEGGKSLYKAIPTSACSPETSPASNSRLVSPTPSMIFLLLANMYKSTGLDSKAILNYGMAVRLDPFCWEATSSLCQIGVDIKVSSLYAHFSSKMFSQLVNEKDPELLDFESTESNKDPFSSRSTFNDHSLPGSFPHPPKPKTNTSFPPQMSRSMTDSLAYMVQNDITSTPTGPHSSKSSLLHPPPSGEPTLSSLSNTFATPPGSLKVSSNLYKVDTLPNAPTKRAARLATSTNKIASVNSSIGGTIPRLNSRLGAAPTSADTRHAVSSLNLSFSTKFHPSLNSTIDSTPLASSMPGKKPVLKPSGQRPRVKSKNALLKSATISTQSSNQQEALKFIKSLYSTITTAYLQFCKYQCDACLKTLELLPLEQANTPWVLSKKARMYFEKVQYDKSADCFEKLRKVDRYRQEDMEYYSTLLWHLQKDVDLTFLASDLITINRHSPQAWCAVGNALSLNRDTENALKCFQRAINLNPELPYPYTLQAHEHVASDAYEHAQDCYRLALRADKRHYNAWYGLGMIFLRLGKNSMAELHFRKAANINPVNVVLLCCIGMVLEKMNRHEESLHQYTLATKLQPSSALSLYKKARLLVKMGKYNEALTDLNLLVTLAPDEASVHFLLGQIYKILKNRTTAVREFTVALNLDPKGSHLIKEALEGLEALEIG